MSEQSKEFYTLRHELDLTQKQLAELLGTANVIISRWENGRTKIPRAVMAVMRLLVLDAEGGGETVRRALLEP